MQSKYNISIIIPVYNEETVIERLVDHLNTFFKDYDRYDAEVIFVDDGSEDRTVCFIRDALHVNYKARIVKLARNFGSHSALRAGVFYSSAPVVMFLPADMQEPIELLNVLYKHLNNEISVVWGYRKSTQVRLVERLFSALYSSFMKKYAVPDYPKTGIDLVLFNEKVKQELNQQLESNSSIFLQILNMGFQQVFVPYDRFARIYGTTKWTLAKKIKLFVDSFVAFSYAPIRLVTIVGLVLSLLGFIWVTYISLRTILIGDLDPGWPTLIGILLIGFGVTNISLGIIAEYLWRTLDAARNRKVFIVDEIIEISGISQTEVD